MSEKKYRRAARKIHAKHEGFKPKQLKVVTRWDHICMHTQMFEKFTWKKKRRVKCQMLHIRVSLRKYAVTRTVSKFSFELPNVIDPPL